MSVYGSASGLSVSGPITALASASRRRKVKISGRRTSGPGGGRKEGPQGRKGSVTPLRTISSPLNLKYNLFLMGPTPLQFINSLKMFLAGTVHINHNFSSDLNVNLSDLASKLI